MPRVITITSGKGGVGKTSISLNLALELASANQRVCLFDADLGLANINILTGIQPENDLEAVIDGSLELGDILIRNYQGIDIIPGSSGVERMADLTRAEAERLIRSFLGLGEYDYFIFDTSAGISSQVLSFCMASQEILLVITPEPTSLTDAYALLKVLSRKRYASTVNVVVNQVKQANNAKQAYSQLRDTVNRFLSVKLSPLGIVARDKHIPMAVIAQTPFVKLFPDSTASKCIHLLGRKLLSKGKNPAPMPLEQFWHRCLGFLSENRPVAKPSPKKQPETAGKNTDPMEMLQRIENKISMLMTEMKQIKEMMAHQAPGTQEPPAAPAEVELDFEAWYTKNRG